MILVFDTETTGIILRGLPASHPSQPRIVQLGAILFDDAQRVVGEMNLLIKPEGFEIPAEAARVHGISTELATRYGVSVGGALRLFLALCDRAELVVAHNFEFDRTMTQSELHRLQLTAEIERFLAKKSFCTMQAATDVCRLPSRTGVGFKWPNLQEAHRHFFSEEFQGAHDAMADVRACARVFWHLRKSSHPDLE